MSNENEILDVLIVGGGLSGLSAGNYLLEHDVQKFVVLEARERVGGRTCSIDYQQHTVDVGGAYVGPFQNRILRLAREFDIKTYCVDTAGKNVLTFSDGRRSTYTGTIPTAVSLFTLLDMNYLLCRTQELSEQISTTEPWANEKLSPFYDRMTMEDWLTSVGETDDGKDLFRATARSILCVEPSEVSMLAWLASVGNGLGIMRLVETENGAQERKFHGGSQQISKRVSDRLGNDRVLLNHVVKHIEWKSSSNLVKVECENNRTFYCRHVIIALAPSLYKTIQFEPKLPAKKCEATEQMYMGSIIKTITVFERPFWKENGFSGILLNTARTSSNPVVYSFDDSSQEDQFYAIMGFIVADSSRAWQKKTREERQRAVCEQYARAFNCETMLTACRAYIEQDWSAERFSGGCYTDVMPKELLTSIREEIRTSCGDRGQLHFAGTELATRWEGYMDGAVQSGERAAFEIISKHLKVNNGQPLLEWINEEPVDDREECRPIDVNNPVLRPSKLEMLLPQGSTVKLILKIGLVSLTGIIAIVIKSRFF